MLDALKEKHPAPQPVSPDALLNPETVNPSAPESHPVLFDQITADVIRCLARRGGSAGPSGLDASA